MYVVETQESIYDSRMWISLALQRFGNILRPPGRAYCFRHAGRPISHVIHFQNSAIRKRYQTTENVNIHFELGANNGPTTYTLRTILSSWSATSLDQSPERICWHQREEETSENASLVSDLLAESEYRNAQILTFFEDKAPLVEREEERLIGAQDSLHSDYTISSEGVEDVNKKLHSQGKGKTRIVVNVSQPPLREATKYHFRGRL
ncbi:uncharacterized protein BDR25DRAFT_318337 [Lindgomyces ingoldianus]|uniref:Uncharacterized protein n=1 Tax=Lindgomyces ingoldianus TaxID=673940 RepID=A0ACB6QEP8_9PLEO|nr:uncharacterized protein BDR25DRAFT_318337 [Lindgomyces ingoldianus]KAF2465469.1 hypothetical protein BDR25DRAFT_318337 [Lindgomyces ingoldianus]